VAQPLGNNAPLFASTPRDAFAAEGGANQFFRNAQSAQQGTDGSFNALMNPPKM
jgi:hypothetical protein